MSAKKKNKKEFFKLHQLLTDKRIHLFNLYSLEI